MISRFVVAVAAIAVLSPSAHAGAASSILASARQAAGGDAWTDIGTINEAGSEQKSGLIAKASRIEDVKGGRWRQVFNSGIVRTDDVWDGRDMWHQDRSGGVHALNSGFMRMKAQTDAWLMRRDYFKPGAAGAKIESLGQRNEGGRSFDALRATPQVAAPVEMWFDAKTHLLDRTVIVMPTFIQTTRYTNYAATSGALFPLKITIEDGTPADTDVFVATQRDVLPRVVDADFAKPIAPHDFTVAGGEVTVPIDFDHDVIIDATLNGRTFAFTLDTGGHDLLTPETAKALGLKPVGNGADGGGGEHTVLEQYVRVDRVQIGGVMLRDQSFKVVPLQYDFTERGAKPPVAGLLGLELFERFAMRLDYRNRTLTFRTLANAPPGKGVPVPITFTDDSPLIEARIDGIAGDNLLDTGNADGLIMQGLWADRHGLGARMRSGIHLAGFGLGGATNTWASRADYEIAGTKFPRVVAFYTEDKKGAFSSRTESGNVGNLVLKNFTLSFDYARSTIWFDRNPEVDMAWPFARAGFNFHKDTPDYFIVSSVLPGTPAGNAGVKVGDEIHSANGKLANVLTDWDLRRMMEEAPGTQLSLSLIRNGKLLNATMTLRELLP